VPEDKPEGEGTSVLGTACSVIQKTCFFSYTIVKTAYLIRSTYNMSFAVLSRRKDKKSRKKQVLEAGLGIC
jgi:hypothetical protein